MSRIRSVQAQEILDSRGNPTLEVSLRTDKFSVKASVPSGSSKGSYEAKESRDGGQRYNGLGVLNAVRVVNQKINRLVKDKSALDQKKIDSLLIEMDGTKDKSKMGSNALLGVSLAVCRAGALTSEKTLYQYINHLSGQDKVSLPRPCFNVINGGLHAGNELLFQEFMVVPRKRKVRDSVQEAVRIYYSLKEIISKRYSSLATNVGDEGGFAPSISDPEDALKLVLETGKTDLIIDVAANEFSVDGGYRMGIRTLSREEMANYYLQLIRKYPILGIEDPFSEDDWQGWQILTSKAEKKMIIGDDLLATNVDRINQAQEKKACNSMIIKLNQVGTVTEALEAVKLAKKNKWKTIVSHRSGETNDDFISDFSVGISADFIKAGAPARGERTAKYNRLMEIEREIENSSC
jgi:enolase